ncbi:AMP-binding enzyme [Colletotrichum lupini]|uniref:AMP-binding enzyme n=1 Tax=Colletotrichum lupini TaxID=145971 RepID=A0A9Q8TB18_9PEZI|nr:AMP-binding enzyme [Colletotrichum lupini]UQC91562.1 AMP-binding enzyme [Colletotrichum lupini]
MRTHPIAVTAAALAGSMVSSMYVDAKYHISKDFKALRGRRTVTKFVENSIKSSRVSPYYFFEEAVQKDPYGEAIWTRSGSVSWKTTYDRANQYAQMFLSQGVRPGDFVAILMQNSPDFAFAWVGLLAIGAAPAMINYNLVGKALLGCIEISTAKLVVVDGSPDIAAKYNDVQTELDLKGIRVVNIGEEREKIYQMDPIRPRDELRKNLTPADAMAMFYTSGTTGLPKAVIMPAAAAGSLALSNDIGLHPTKSGKERCYICMVSEYAYIVMSEVSKRIDTAVLSRDWRYYYDIPDLVCMAPKFSVSNFWEDVRDSHATWFVYVGETLRYLLASPPSPRDKDHNIHAVFGNGCRPDVWKRFQERFGVDTRDPKTGLALRASYEVGGEILVEHPGERAFPGYFNNEDATNKKFVRDILKKGDCFYRTGDSLRRDSEGRWFFLDRLGDTYRWKGENVSTAEVSEVLGSYPGVNEAVVYGVQLPGHDGKAGAAALDIAADQKGSFNYADFLSFARSKLPRYAVPVFIRLLNEGTATHNNKQNKVPLKNEGVDPSKIQGGDQLLWIEKHGKGSTYVPFTQDDWNNLGMGKAKL